MEEAKTPEHSSSPTDPLPKGQQIFDNWILLFVLSLLISGLIYNVWGLFQTLTSPPLP